MPTLKLIPAGAILLALGACTTLPSGPNVMVLPGDHMSFEQFRADDGECRQFAHEQISTATASANDGNVRNAVVGTLVGAAAGAAMNGHQGAGVGAGAGLLMGSLAGGNGATRAGYSLQVRYDNSYQQCMYAKGHRVPAGTRVLPQRRTITQPLSVPPPPPPGTPPPPPPDVVLPR